MRRSQGSWLLIVSLLALAQVGITRPPAHSPSTYDTPDARVEEADVGPARWLRAARASQTLTRTHLRTSDQPACSEATFISYRRSDLQPDVSDQWYIASQLWADAELLLATGALLTQTPVRAGDSWWSPDRPTRPA